MITWRGIHSSCGWSYTDHETDHAQNSWLSCTDHLAEYTLITWLIMYWSHGYHALITWLSCTDHVAIMHWSRDWSCTDHFALIHFSQDCVWPDHVDGEVVITCLIMHWAPGWSCTNHVADHALITWLSCTDPIAIMHWSRDCIHWSGD